MRVRGRARAHSPVKQLHTPFRIYSSCEHAFSVFGIVPGGDGRVLPLLMTSFFTKNEDPLGACGRADPRFYCYRRNDLSMWAITQVWAVLKGGREKNKMKQVLRYLLGGNKVPRKLVNCVYKSAHPWHTRRACATTATAKVHQVCCLSHTFPSRPAMAPHMSMKFGLEATQA